MFAFADESGIAPELKAATLARVAAGTAEITTDLRASPTGFPFKLLKLPGTNAMEADYAARARTCDLGYLRTAYRRADGRIGFRCPAEAENDWQNKGGEAGATQDRKCLCNGLLANVGLGQLRADGEERPLITAGNTLIGMNTFLRARNRYSANDVIDYLLSPVE